MKSLLEFRHLRFGWRRQPRPLFSSLDLEVPSKTATVLLGPNGAGKTTIMDLALGWRLPQEGEIFLGGKPIGRWGNRERGRFMALVPQDEAILFDYSVMEYILLGRAPHLPPPGNSRGGGQEDCRRGP